MPSWLFKLQEALIGAQIVGRGFMVHLIIAAHVEECLSDVHYVAPIIRKTAPLLRSATRPLSRFYSVFRRVGARLRPGRRQTPQLSSGSTSR